MFIPYSENSKVINTLYNLKEDPYEVNNLLGNNPERQKFQQKAEELRDDLLLWLKKHNSKFYEGVKARNLLGIDKNTGLIDRPLYQFRIYLNPASRKITVDSINRKIDGIFLYDMFGQKIYSDKESFTGLKTIDLPPYSGICFVKPIGEFPFKAQKVMVE